MLVGAQATPRVKDSFQDDPRSDHQLVAALNAGESTAFDAIYYRHRDWVVNLAFRFTGNREAALDVLQETFLYLVRKVPGFQLTCRLRTFLYPVVRSLSISFLRRAARHASLDEMTEGGTLAEPTAPASADTEPSDLGGVLRDLGEAHREVVLLRFVEGFDLQEIAQALDLPVGTVKSRLHHALNRLRRNPRTRAFFND
jgi:RNA polymerase sigma-70 factor (ECF subfamily)